MNDDLISRKALKKAITDATYNFEQIPIRVDKVQEIIDNAPTVPLPDFKEGYKQAIIDGKTNFSRPHGKWIPTVIDTGLFERSVCREWKCSNCGEVVKIKYPFCHCGADMRKETEHDDT